MQLSTLAVFCGSSLGDNALYESAAVELGSILGVRGIELVYGGGSGLMDALAAAAVEAGGRVTAIVPQAFKRGPTADGESAELVLVQSIHERKQRIADRADAFLALPGGSGTLEEIAEQWTWAQVGVHEKPSAIVNVAGFYDPYLALVSNMVDRGFTKPRGARMLLVDTSVSGALDRLASYQHPVRPKT